MGVGWFHSWYINAVQYYITINISYCPFTLPQYKVFSSIKEFLVKFYPVLTHRKQRANIPSNYFGASNIPHNKSV